MRGLPFLFALILLSTLTAGVAAAEGGAITIPAFSRSDVLALTLRSGDVIDFSWSSSASVDFRIDLVGTGEVFSQVGQVGSGTYRIPLDGMYIFTIRNDNASQVTVNWTIAKRVVDVLPWAVAAAAVALVGIAGVAIWRQRRRRTWARSMVPPPQTSQTPPLR